jgi:hypothetical protein
MVLEESAPPGRGPRPRCRHCKACGDLSQRTVDLLGDDIQEGGDEQLVAELGDCGREKLVEGTCKTKVSRLKMRERFEKSGLG